jgi:glycosyltransferase involved in cell wall biosynthesis
MKIVQLGPYPPPHGGVQTNLVAIRDFVRRQGSSCAVINITRHRQAELDDVYFPHSSTELVWDLFSKRYDLVHLHIGGGIPLRVQALALAATSVPWAKSILTLHSGGFPSSPEGKAATRSSFLAFVLRRFRYIIGVNQEMIEFFVRLGVPRSRTRLILPHSVAVAQMADHLPEPLAGFFAQYDRVLVAVCGLEPEYDIPRQIEALKAVLDAVPRTGLAVLGSGSQKSIIEQQVANCSYRDHILMCGDVPHAVTLRAIAESEILLRTTLYDGDAISIREALYLQTPVIATDNGMRPAGVHLIPIGDTNALVLAIKKVLESHPAHQPRPERDDSNLAAVFSLYEEALGKR